MPGASGNYSREELEQLASSVGFTGDDIKIAAAVALAESGGNPNSHNTKAPDNSYGLWQINMYGNLGPSRRKAYGLPSNETLFDPHRNAMVAKHIKDSSGWGAWTTYTSGKYKANLDRSFIDTVKDGLTQVTGVESVASSINALGQNLFKGVASITGIIVALVLLVLGVLILLRNQIPVKKIAKKVAL